MNGLRCFAYRTIVGWTRDAPSTGTPEQAEGADALDPSDDAVPRLAREMDGISGAVRALVAAIDEVSEAERDLDHRVRAEFGVNTTDVAALQYVDRITRRGRPALARDIARRFDLRSGTATEVVHRLERAGLLRRTTDPSDGRNRVLELTDQAAARLEELIGDVRSDLNELLDAISGEEEARLIELLGAVRDIYRGSNRQDRGRRDLR